MSEQIEGQKKLRECPFCGGEAEARYLPVNGSPGNELYGLCGCNPCDVTFFSADKFVKGQEMEAIAQAVELWNTRRSPDKRLREVATLLKKVLSCGLNEGTPGVGPVASKSEKRAADIALEIESALAAIEEEMK